MIRLYCGSGSTEIEIGTVAMLSDEWARVRTNAANLLRARARNDAARLLVETPFEVRHGTNGFGDEFALLFLRVPVEEYVRYEERSKTPALKAAYKDIADAITELGTYIRFVAVAIAADNGVTGVAFASPAITSDAVERALRDAQQLLASRGASSGVDRIHTVWHGYLLALCADAKIPIDKDASSTQIFATIRKLHPAFAADGPRGDDVEKIVRALANIADALDPIRNRASGSHPNPVVLDEPEAMLVINAVHTMLHYIDARLRASAGAR